MVIKKFISIIFVMILSANIVASDITTFKDVFTQVPKTTLNVLETSVSKKSIPYWAAIGLSTFVLYQYDENILLEAQRLGRKSGVGNEDETETIIEVGGHNILRAPKDTGAWLYFIGDGWLHFSIASSFLIYGKIADNNKAVKTSYQIMHGMVTSTITSQFLKRLTGRESPFVATKPRGSWRLLPSYSEYSGNTPKYDAFPSGHVMTATMTFTIIDNNYPEYRHIIRPVGITLITLLALQMMNNGVHWASDYPLAIAMGYVYGKEVSRSLSKSKNATQNNFSLSPMYSKNIRGLKMNYLF